MIMKMNSIVKGYGGSSLYDGRFLVNAGIVLVTINYRLGALANLLYGTGDKEIKGNLDIKAHIYMHIIISLYCFIAGSKVSLGMD